MAKTDKKTQAEKVEQQQPAHFGIILFDNITGVQIAAGTENLDKFTRTDLMKMVAAFKKEVDKEEKHIADIQKKAEKELKDEPNKRSDSKTRGKRVRSSRKVRKP